MSSLAAPAAAVLLTAEEFFRVVRGAEDELDGQDVLPGLRLALANLFG